MRTDIDLNALVEAFGDAIIVSDTAGIITLWNPAATRMFGYSEAEALGQSLDIIIPERMRQRHWEGYQKTMQTGVTKYGHDILRVPAIGKDGKNLSIAFTVALLHDAQGNVTAIASIMRDETERFNKDRATRKRLDELERRVRAAAMAPAER
jgi:PAS domain S-box-containing protein